MDDAAATVLGLIPIAGNVQLCRRARKRLAIHNSANANPNSIRAIFPDIVIAPSNGPSR